MSITTAHGFDVEREEKAPGFWARLGHRVIESRTREAERVVAAYLMDLDDATLDRLGVSRSDLEQRDPRSYPFL